MTRNYQIESTMRGTPRGGDWQGPWAIHTPLDGVTLKEARRRFRAVRDMFEPEVRAHFRLARLDQRTVVLSA